MFELYAIHDDIFTEFPYFPQIQPFDLVALVTNLQEHLDSRMNHIQTQMEWVTQIGGSYINQLNSPLVSKPLPHAMLTMEERKEIHFDFVKATDFLGTIYKAYEDLINVDVIHGQPRQDARKGQENFQTN